MQCSIEDMPATNAVTACAPADGPPRNHICTCALVSWWRRKPWLGWNH